MQKRTLYWHQTGPLLAYGEGTLLVSDLNPHVETKWRMTRGEMFLLGWRCIVAAVTR